MKAASSNKSRLLFFLSYLCILSKALFLKRFINRFIKRNSEEVRIAPYNGPYGDLGSMDLTIPHPKLDVDLMIGKSTISGKGLFVKVREGKKNCVIERGNTV